MKTFFGLVVLASVFVVGCSKDTSSDVAPIVKTEKSTSTAPGVPGGAGTAAIPQSAKDAMAGKGN